MSAGGTLLPQGGDPGRAGRAPAGGGGSLCVSVCVPRVCPRMRACVHACLCGEHTQCSRMLDTLTRSDSKHVCVRVCTRTESKRNNELTESRDKHRPRAP